MEKLKRFAELFAVPEFVVPYLDYFLTDEEIDFVLSLGSEKATLEQLIVKTGKEQAEAINFIENCYQCHILDRSEVNGETIYSISDFYAKLDYQCKFGERYHELDKAVRDQLDAWCYDVYKEKMLPYIDQLSRGEAVERTPETFELLEHLDELIDSTHEIRVVPCNCRRLAENCSKPVETCLAFDSSITDRTQGKPLTKEEAKEIIRLDHQKGLMHQINVDWRENGPAWMCNCCSCCCYPTRLASELGSKGTFPVVQYVAVRDLEKCTHCGICTKRCNFSAFYFEDEEIEVKGKPRKKVGFDPEKCWGCGICTSTCQSEAISMSSSAVSRQ